MYNTDFIKGITMENIKKAIDNHDFLYKIEVEDLSGITGDSKVIEGDQSHMVAEDLNYRDGQEMYERWIDKYTRMAIKVVIEPDRMYRFKYSMIQDIEIQPQEDAIILSNDNRYELPKELDYVISLNDGEVILVRYEEAFYFLNLSMDATDKMEETMVELDLVYRWSNNNGKDLLRSRDTGRYNRNMYDRNLDTFGKMLFKNEKIAILENDDDGEKVYSIMYLRKVHDGIDRRDNWAYYAESAVERLNDTCFVVGYSLAELENTVGFKRATKKATEFLEKEYPEILETYRKLMDEEVRMNERLKVKQSNRKGDNESKNEVIEKMDVPDYEKVLEEKYLLLKDLSTVQAFKMGRCIDIEYCGKYIGTIDLDSNTNKWKIEKDSKFLEISNLKDIKEHYFSVDATYDESTDGITGRNIKYNAIVVSYKDRTEFSLRPSRTMIIAD